jgi:anti-sigma regulatory factor (Ser/Thr protein kinase)/putative methionine-R-sulfoxide reductase with GAF domain
MTPDSGIRGMDPGSPELDETAGGARLEDIQQVTDTALSYLKVEDLLSELLERVRDILEVDTAAVLLIDDEGTTLAARAAKGLEEEVERGFRLPIGAGFAGRIAATREAVVIEDLDRSPIEVVNPLMREKGVRSLLGVPLIVEGELIGVLHVGSLTPRPFSEEDLTLLEMVGDRVALSIERSRLAVQSRVAQTLQQSLLPRELPELVGLQMAARYLPAARESAVGGDWYDVIELGEREIGIVMGDVAGSGMAAATFMGQLRSVLRAYAMDQRSPADVVTSLARFVDRERGPMTTLIYAKLVLETNEVEFARAGHPYPLVVGTDGKTRFVESEGGLPLGAGLGVPYTSERVTIEPGDTLIFYTDGLIERRGERLSDGEAALAEAVAMAPANPELMCTAVLERLTGGLEINDDVAILVVQAVGLDEVLELEVAADPGHLAGIRHLTRRWLTKAGAADDDCAAFAIAVTEACANAIAHAYGAGGGTMSLRISSEQDVVTVRVRDSGSWREPRGDERGRGIDLMREFMDEVVIDRAPSGTTLVLERRLRGRAR